MSEERYVDPDSWRNVKSYLIPNNDALYEADRHKLESEWTTLTEYLDNKYGPGVIFLTDDSSDYDKYIRAASIAEALHKMEDTYQKYGPLYGYGNPVYPQVLTYSDIKERLTERRKREEDRRRRREERREELGLFLNQPHGKKPRQI